MAQRDVSSSLAKLVPSPAKAVNWKLIFAARERGCTWAQIFDTLPKDTFISVASLRAAGNARLQRKRALKT